MTMKFKVSRADMWSATIEDQPGGAARVLDPVAKAGANFDFAFARRAPELPGKGLLFVLPVKGAKVLQAAQAAGLAKAEGIHTVKSGGREPARHLGGWHRPVRTHASRCGTENALNARHCKNCHKSRLSPHPCAACATRGIGRPEPVLECDRLGHEGGDPDELGLARAARKPPATAPEGPLIPAKATRRVRCICLKRGDILHGSENCP